jgi:hypothetical protein
MTKALAETAVGCYSIGLDYRLKNFIIWSIE